MPGPVYWDKTQMKYDGATPSILAIGDSWFWYPFVGVSLIVALGELVARKQHIIYCLGNNGAEAIDYTQGRYRRALGGSAWLRPALVEARVPLRLHRPAVKLVIDRFAEIFGNIAAASSGRVIFVDSRGTLTRSTQWANELHPTPAGFKKIAIDAWESLLVADNLA